MASRHSAHYSKQLAERFGAGADELVSLKALAALSLKEKEGATAVLDAMIVKNQVAGALDRVKQRAAKAKKRAKRGAHAKE